MAKLKAKTDKDHPAKFSEDVIKTMAGMLPDGIRILDPFGGIGGIFDLNLWMNAEIEAIELEGEWAVQHPRTRLGNALALPFPDGWFDAVATSPTFGNRMADKLIDQYKRVTYAAMLERPLHPDNSGAMQWGKDYREFHRAAWIEARRVLKPGGLLCLNMKDHIRGGIRQRVTLWHIFCLMGIGFEPIKFERVTVRGMGYGQNGAARVPYESVILFQLNGGATNANG